MADLSSLDSSKPLGSDSLSYGDDEIRATRLAVKTSFGGTDSGSGTQISEHYLKGFHKFPYGTTANTPSAGNAGRVYINTEHGRIDYDTGSQWNMLNASQAYQTTGGLVTNILSNWKTLVTQTSVVVPNGGRVVAYGMGLLIPSSQTTLHLRLKIGSNVMLPVIGTGENAIAAACVIPNSGGTLNAVGYYSPTAGTYSVTLEVKSYDPVTSYGTGGLIVVVL